MSNRTATRLWAFALSLTAVFGGMGCLVSGFGLEPIGFGTAVSWILTAAVFSICLPRRIGWYPLGGLALLGAFLWLRGYLSRSMELLLQELSGFYDNAYGWGVMNWSGADLSEVRTGTALCWLGLPIVICVCYGVLRRRGTAGAVLVSVLPLACCMIVTDTAPDTLPLAALLLAAVLLMMTHTVRSRDEAQGNRLLALLTLPVAAGLALLFLLIPRDTYDRQEGAQRLEDTVVEWLHGDFELPELPQITQPTQPQATQSSHGSGSAPKQENLLTVGPKIQSDLRVLTVQSDHGGTLYLRGAGYDTYTGTAWSAEVRQEVAAWPEEALLEDGGEVRIFTAITHEAVYLPYYADRELYSSMSGGRLANSQRLTEYTFRVGLLEPGQLPGGASESYGADMEPYLQLPEQTRLWAEGVIEELFGTESPARDLTTVYTVAEYVRSSAEYSLNTPRMDTDYGDFARWFLTESDRGYCIHFASATAVLLRAAGIPSRYVTGYTVSAEAGQSVAVTGKHAHAWAEFCLPGGVWYPLESTPAYEAEDIPEQTFPQVTRPSQPDETEPTVPQTQPPDTQPPEASGNPWPWVAAGLAVTAVVIQWRVRVALRRGRVRRGRSKRKALERWRQHECMARLLKQQPDQELLRIAQKAKFSQHPIPPEELAAFTRILRDQTAQLRKKPVWLQLYYTLILALY